MDTASLIVVLGAIILALGIALMRRGSKGAEEEESAADDSNQ